jgi:HSP20 family protein
MASNEVTKTGGNGPAATPPARRPVDIFDAMRQDMDRVFDRFERGWPSLGRLAGLGTAWPQATTVMEAALDVRDEGKQFVIEADLPGVEEKDVNIVFADGILTIKGERKSSSDEKKDSYHIAERSFGQFSRSLRLPDSVDEGAIEAKFEKGVLHIVAPKRPEAVKTERQIEIKKS